MRWPSVLSRLAPRLAPRLALAAVALGTLLATTVVMKPASACGRGIDYGAGGLAALAVGTLAITDAVFVAYDVSHTGLQHGPSEAWSKGETYVQVPQVAVMALLVPAWDSEVLPTALAFTALPAALSVHGFYGTNGTWGERWQFPVGVVSALDAGLVGYDVVSAVRGKRPDEIYALAEILVGGPQVLFGLSFASGTSGRTLGAALALTALPTALVAHGVVVLEVAAHEGSEPKAANAPVKDPSPRFSLAPMAAPGTVGLTGFGVF